VADAVWKSTGDLGPGGTAITSRDLVPTGAAESGGGGPTENGNILFSGAGVEAGGDSFDITD